MGPEPKACRSRDGAAQRMYQQMDVSQQQAACVCVCVTTQPVSMMYGRSPAVNQGAARHKRSCDGKMRKKGGGRDRVVSPVNEMPPRPANSYDDRVWFSSP